MIYTVTFNPSLDYVVSVKHFAAGILNRTSGEEIFEGGKGINVSIVLKNLGIESVALGFTAGFVGDAIETAVRAHGCRTDFIHLSEGLSRINIKLKSEEETEINGQGPDISKDALECLFKQLDQLADGDLLVLAGSVPGTLPGNIYEQIMVRLQHKDVKIIVDATRELLTKVLKYRPFLIKPNQHELGEIFNLTLAEKSEAAVYAKKLQQMGAVNVLVSMAGAGAVLISEQGEVYECLAPQGSVINSVGAGDSMVAGFLAGYLETGDYRKALYMGVAAGSASAFSQRLATRLEAEQLLQQIVMNGGSQR